MKRGGLTQTEQGAALDHLKLRSFSSIPLTRGKSIPIKPIPGWQMFVALWVLQKLWGKYSDSVTDKAKHHRQISRAGADAVQQFAVSGDNTKTQTITVEPVVHESVV